MKFLVGYTSVHGSTTEVAHFIAAILREYSFEVRVANVESLSEVGTYDAFMLGSPIHNSTILPAMSAFVRRFRDELTLKPVYFWVTCIRVLEPGGWRHVMENYIPYDVDPGINPAQVAAFAGRVDFAEINLNERWALAAHYDGSATPADGDFRDWDAIRAWVEPIATALAPASPAQEDQPDESNAAD